MMQNSIDKQEFNSFCANLNLNMHEASLDSMRNYLELLFKWNDKINLTGACNWQEALSNLVADSFYLADFLNQLTVLPQSPQVWDLGAGAGLPGIPLRIIWQNGEYHFVESRKNRANFLQIVHLHLKLDNTFAHSARAEKFMPEQKSKGCPANCIISRAFMPWRELTNFVQPNLAPGGVLLLMQNGESFNEEILGWSLLKQHSYQSPKGPRQFVALRLE